MRRPSRPLVEGGAEFSVRVFHVQEGPPTQHTVPMTRSQGAQFLAADLHVHTPASHDFRDKDATARQLIDAAVAKNLSLLGITDHNSGEWIDQLRAASKGTPLTVIAGTEVTTPEGHIIGLFDSDYTTEAVRDFLIQVGVPRADHGREEAISAQHAEEVIRAIEDAGGVAIAAHANTKAIGLLQQKGQYKLRVVPLPELRALEFTQRIDLERFAEGLVSRDYPAKACVQGSDSHALSEMGSRVTFLKMDEVSVHGIRQALIDYPVRVRFPWNLPKSEHPRILGLSVDQGFFAGQDFVFHGNLNCLVGGQGAGKSTVIELMRYCFADVSTFEHIAIDHAGKIENLVGDGGTVEVRFQDSDGEQKKVRRQVHPWRTEREVTDLQGNVAELLAPPAFFSQGELVDIARSPIAQLELIDRRLDVSEENAEESALLGKLAVNTQELVSTEQKLVRLDQEMSHAETGLSATTAKHALLAAKLADPVLKTFPAWETEQRYLKQLDEAIEHLLLAFTDAIDELEVDDFEVEPPTDAPNAKLIRPLGKLGSSVLKILERTKTAFRSEVDGLRKAVVMVKDQVQPSFEAQRTNHDRILKSLAQADVRKATSQFRALGSRLEALKKQTAERERLVDRMRKGSERRSDTVRKLHAIRSQRATKRQQKASQYQGALSGIVELQVRAFGERTALVTALRELSRGAMIREPDLERIAITFDPSELRELIVKQDGTTIAAQAGITKEVAGRFVERCLAKGTEKLYGLDSVPIGDLPVLSYVVAPGRIKPVDELSTGQKGTVIISLALVEGAGPLVIDHPEEPLDTKSIYGQVVSKLREGKETRQFIFTTHNANIAVGADAELNHILGATADKGAIECRGGIDEAETNRLLLLHLEGGEEALHRRVEKYRL